jgi:conjugative relaxase-like TrwC/TraI family protein
MLSLSNVSVNQAENYYANDDYYTQDSITDEASAKWVGKGAIALNLPKTVQTEHFKALLQGQDLSGQPLHAKRINAQNHRAGTDYTLSAPKSVSIAALVQRDERVIVAHDRAVETTLKIMEQRYVQARITTDTGRQKVKTGNLIAAVFRHETSREQDPQLHSHCVVTNATQMPDDTWRSLSNEAVIAHQKLLGEIYQNELAYQLRQIGYGIEPRTNGQFELAGYSPELLDTYSTRSQEIKAYLDKFEQSNAAQRKQATLKTRKNKAKDLPRDVLLQGWQAQIESRSLTLPDIPGERSVIQGEWESESASERSVIQGEWKSERSVINRESNANIAVNAGVNHWSERESIFRRSQVERFALEHHLGEQCFDDLQKAFSQNRELICLDPIHDRYTTQTAIQRELDTIRLMQQGKGKVHPIVSAEFTNRFTQLLTLTEGQEKAIFGSLMARDRIMAWQGVAGSGKTYALYQFAQIAQSQGFSLKGFTPSSAAAQVLEEQAEIPSDTVASLLCSSPRSEPLLGKEIWIVDEAGLLSAKDAYELLQRSTAQQARVIFVGDTRQLSAVAAGNPFRSLQAAGMTTIHLDQSLRQKTESLKAAVALITEGQIEQGIEQLEKSGSIQIIAEDDRRLAQMTADYLALSPAEREKTLLVAGTHETRRQITDRIRAGLRESQQLGPPAYWVKGLQPKNLTNAQARYAKYYEVGDVIVPHQTYKNQGLEKGQQYIVIEVQARSVNIRSPTGETRSLDLSKCDHKTIYRESGFPIAVGDQLRWTKNDRANGIRNGQTFTIASIDMNGDAEVLNSDGSISQLNLKGHQYLDYAWVSTTYSAQGKTADRVLALTDTMTSRESFYVAVSRAKYDLTIYASDRAELLRLAQTSRANQTVIPLHQQVHHAPTPQTTQNPDFPDHGNPVRDLGANLAATLPEDRFLRDSLDRLDRGTSRNAAAFASLSRTVANYAQRQEQLADTQRILATIDGQIAAIEQQQATQRARLLAQIQEKHVRQIVSACQVIVNRVGQEMPVGRQVITKSYRIDLSGPTLKLEARYRNEVDYHHVLTYDMGSKQFSTDRSTEQLASAATYFGLIVTKMTQHQAQPQVVQRHRSQGMEL